MANIAYTYEHYLVKASLNGLELLHQPDEIPVTTDEPALWRCKVTGEIFDRTFHQLPNQQCAASSPGQKYWETFRPQYEACAAYYGLEFVYNPLVDLAPYDTRTPVKWRTKKGNVVVMSLHELKFGKKLRKAVTKLMGISEDTPPFDTVWKNRHE